MSRSLRDVQALEARIRALEPGDLPMILELERRSYSFPWSEGVFKDCFRPNYRLWGLDCDGYLVAYAIVVYMAGEAHLLNLCVSNEHRRAGFGRRLLRHLVAEAAKERMFQVILEVRVSNEAAAGLYLQEGFSEIGLRPRYYPAGHEREDARVLSLTLLSGASGPS